MLLAALAFAVTAVPAASPRPIQTEAVIVSGPLVHYPATNSLFHIDGLWMRVQAGTLLHRWLLTGSGHQAAIGVTLEPDQYADRPNIRIMPGRLLHQIDPNTSPFVHMFLLQDLDTGRFGSVTFQTKDPVLWRTLDAWSDLEVSIVIQIHPE